MKQLLATFCKLCWAYIKQIGLKLRIFLLNRSRRGLNKQISKLESSESLGALPPHEEEWEKDYWLG